MMARYLSFIGFLSVYDVLTIAFARIDGIARWEDADSKAAQVFRGLDLPLQLWRQLSEKTSSGR
jgi:hypothetical protein